MVLDETRGMPIALETFWKDRSCVRYIVLTITRYAKCFAQVCFLKKLSRVIYHPIGHSIRAPGEECRCF